VADVKCGLYEINTNKRANSTHVPSLVHKSPVQKVFRDQTEAILDRSMLDQRGAGPGPVLTLLCFRNSAIWLVILYRILH